MCGSGFLDCRAIYEFLKCAAQFINRVVKEVVEAQKDSDRMFLELEEKQMKHEADQKKEEREFQLKMMSMLFPHQGSRASLMPDCYGPAYQPFEDSEYN